MIKRTINGYYITEEIKEGGMATVYKGVNQQGFIHAFKVVRPDRAENNPALYTRFLKEIEILRQLREQPNIVNADGVHNINNTTVLEMEFLDGLDFDDYIKQNMPNGITEKEQLKNISKSVLDALNYAHEKQILHLDIKPSNIFRTSGGYVKLLDFGIAKVVGEEADKIYGSETVTQKTETGESTFKGTVAYSSPEQQAGAPLGVTSDIFSLGKTLHFITTGTDDMSVECTIKPFDEIIEKCTQQNPKKRFRSCNEIINFIDTPVIKEIKCINADCGKSISVSVKFCPHCGKEQIKLKEQTILCPECNKENKKETKFCIDCGHDFERRVCGKCGKQESKDSEFRDGNTLRCIYCGTRY